MKVARHRMSYILDTTSIPEVDAEIQRYLRLARQAHGNTYIDTEDNLRYIDITHIRDEYEEVLELQQGQLLPIDEESLPGLWLVMCKLIADATSPE